nr:hypothetical protein [Tanacetum cinerariifolium]
MRTRSSSNLPVVSPNPSTSNPKRYNRRRSKQPFILDESPIDTMADQRTMAELLRAPTEGYAEAIVVPSILAEQFELKHSLINMMTLDQFFGLEKDNPHDDIPWKGLCLNVQKINKIRKISTQDQKPQRKAGSGSKFSSNKIIMKLNLSKFQSSGTISAQRSKPNPSKVKCQSPGTNYDALDSATGGNFLDKIPRECLSIIESKSKVRYSRSRVTVVRANANAPPSSSSHSNSFDLQQIAAALEDKLDIRMYRFEKSLNEIKNSLVTPTAPLKPSRKFALPADQTIAIINVHSLEEEMIFRNTIVNPKGEAKAITTRSGMSYKEPPIPPSGVSQQDPVEVTTDTEPSNSDDIHPPTVQAEADTFIAIDDEPISSNIGATYYDPKEISSFWKHF